MKRIIIVSFMALGLCGCAQDTPQHSNITQRSVQSTQNKTAGERQFTPRQEIIATPAQQPSDSEVTRRLKICLYEAKQLNQISNNAYAAQTNELYRDIKAARYYAGVSSGISNATAQMVTPLYQYKINDICNNISQSLLKELKKNVGLTSRG